MLTRVQHFDDPSSAAVACGFRSERRQATFTGLRSVNLASHDNACALNHGSAIRRAAYRAFVELLLADHSHHLSASLRSQHTRRTEVGLLILYQFLNRFFHIFGLGQDEILNLRSISDESVGGADPAYRGVEVFEQLVRYAGGDLGAVAV